MDMPLALLNTSIVTEDGTYTLRTVCLGEARQLVADAPSLDSAVGHEATAAVMAELLGVSVPLNRQEFAQQPGQRALVCKLNGRPPESAVLTREQMEEIGYTFRLLIREPEPTDRWVVSTFTEQGDRNQAAAGLTAGEVALLRRLDAAGAGIRVDPAAHVETQLRIWLGKLAAEDAALEHTPDAMGGWASRNELVRLVVRDAQLVGFRAGYATDPDGHEGFRSVAWVELPTDQVSWHLPDFPYPTDPNWVWDGHTRKEKAQRIAAYLATAT